MVRSYSAATLDHRPSRSVFELLTGWFAYPALVAAAILGAYQLFLALQSPGQVIRRELIAAGAEMRSMPWRTSPDRIREGIQRHFAGYSVTVDPAGFPAYAKVTLGGLSRDVCFDANLIARRIEGDVVIAIEKASVGQICRDDAEVTWRIMP